MSSYIIAGSADSIDTAYCEEIARRIKAKYTNIDFRIVIKHPSEWEEYLQQICRIYGFLKKSNPIVYTFDGKIIGNKDAFVQTTSKYFGLDEEALIVDHLSNKINMKLAEEEISRKKIVKNNIKTMSQKIQAAYQSLLKSKILKHELKEKSEHLVNGIEYIHRQVAGLCQKMAFIKNKNIPVVVEEVVPEDINLMALSLNDQIKPEQGLAAAAFVTNNHEKDKHAPSQADRMSEASKTNKMHESIVSYDKDSKGVKESNQTKLRIDEENDQIPDYIDYPMKQTIICQIADQFYVAFETKSHISGQMIFYHNEDANGNVLRVHNDGRPIKGHRVLVKEVHFDGELAAEDLPNQIIGQVGQAKQENHFEQNLNLSNHETHQKPVQTHPEHSAHHENHENHEKHQSQHLQHEKTPGNPNQHQNFNHLAQKSKTQPNIPILEAQTLTNQKFAADPMKIDKIENEEAISEPHTDLNIISHLNYHTLFIQKPLSNVQIKNLIYFIQETDTIGCLQFLPQNPNPKMKLYNRKYLLNQGDNHSLLPVQKFIQKQIEENQISHLNVPSEKGTLLLISQINETFSLTIIQDLGFEHYLYLLSKNQSEEQLFKIIKYTVDHLLHIEEQVRRDIGYNLIFTKKFIMLVPIVEPYEVYNEKKEYLDGLAYLGYVHTAKFDHPYKINQPKVGNQSKGAEIRSMLAKCSGKKIEE